MRYTRILMITILLSSCFSPDSLQVDYLAESEVIKFSNTIEEALPQTVIFEKVENFIKSSGDKKKKVLVVGWDGVRLDAMLTAKTKNLDSIATDAYVLYTGGDKDNLQYTSSGPGWATILTGEWADVNGIVNNGIERKNSGVPSFLKAVKSIDSNLKIGSAVNWAPINLNILGDELELLEFHSEGVSDDKTADKAVEFIRSGVDVLFVQLDNPDAFGHGGGFTPFCPSYVGSISVADRRLGRMLDAVYASAAKNDEDWLVLVTTDHGGYGKNHGGHSYAERTVWLVSNKKL
ncbi:MAG: hypothetical protein JXR63_09105 [Spirochaetales bacterium]|nr:hypothetical protein [Spirochaetales bacterium]